MIKFLIVVTGWNCSQYVQSCIESIKKQTYKNFEVIIVDDASTDDTTEKILFHTKDMENCKTVRFEKNVGTVYARDFAIKKCTGFDVVVWVDLDDMLRENALEVVAKKYEDPECWLTYGNYRTETDSMNAQDLYYSSECHKNRNYRVDSWKFVHLRTFRKELYEKLSSLDLFPGTEVYPDANMLYCLLEMAGSKHIRVIEEHIYFYRIQNPLSVLNRFNEEERNKDMFKVVMKQKSKPVYEL